MDGMGWMFLFLLNLMTSLLFQILGDFWPWNWKHLHSELFCRYILGDYVTYILSMQLIFGGSFALMMEVSFVLASSFMWGALGMPCGCGPGALFWRFFQSKWGGKSGWIISWPSPKRSCHKIGRLSRWAQSFRDLQLGALWWNLCWFYEEVGINMHQWHWLKEFSLCEASKTF